MKIIVNYFKMAFSIFVLIVCMACSKEEFSEKELVGKWQLKSKCNMNTENVEDYNGSVFYQFEEDGTGKRVIMNQSNTASVLDIVMWEVFGNMLVIKFFNGNTADKYYIQELSNSEMVWWEEIQEYRSFTRYEYTFWKI